VGEAISGIDSRNSKIKQAVPNQRVRCVQLTSHRQTLYQLSAAVETYAKGKITSQEMPLETRNRQACAGEFVMA
jgi:hypothetical protein